MLNTKSLSCGLFSNFSGEVDAFGSLAPVVARLSDQGVSDLCDRLVAFLDLPSAPVSSR